MRRNQAVGLLGIAVMFIPSTVLAQLACSYLNDEKPKQGLPYGGGTVIAEKVQIDHAQKSHFIKIFSDTAQRQKSRFDQCFRYEAESETHVRYFSWPLAGMRVDPLLPGLANRRSRTVVYQIHEDPRQVVTPIFAFENSSAKAKAWSVVAQTGSQTPPRTMQGSNDTKLVLVTPDAVIPGLGQFLQQRGTPTSAFFAYYPDASTSSPHSLHDSYSGPNFRIDVRSQVTRKSERVVLMIDVVASGSESERARYAMPAMRALQQIDGPVSKLESYERFTKAFEQAGRETYAHQTKWTFIREFAVPELSNGGLFLVRYPVLIDRSGQRDCVLAATYSPIALNYGLQHCPQFVR